MLTTDRLPPANVEAEELILGGILLDPLAIAKISDLNPDVFSLTFHKKIFKACKSLFDKGQPTDLMSVTTWLADRKLLDAVGGQNMLINLVSRTVSAVNIDQYAALVKEKYYRRIIADLGEQLYERAHQTAIDTNSVVKWALEKVEELPALSKEEALDTHKYRKCISEIQEIELHITDPGLKAWKLKKLANKYDCTPRQLEEIYYRSLLAEDDEPIMTWEQAIEKHGSAIREWRMHGWLPKGKLIIEHGDGGAGKTRLSYNFLYHVATGQDWEGFPVKQGKAIVIQTDEAPSDMLQVLEDRGLANHPLVRYKTRWNIDFLQGLIQEIEQFKPVFILIDSLTSINKRSIFSENDVEYARPLLLLKDVAQKYGITIIVIHHSSREGNARGSTAIRNSASEVWRLKVDNSLSADGSHRILEIEKSRSRKLGSYLLRYNEDDGSWTCLGKPGSDNNEGGVGGQAKERIIKFLKRSPGTFFHPEEIQNEIGGGIDHVRRCCSELAQEGIISRKGRRPALYGINFGDTEPTAAPPGPDLLSTPLSGFDTTDRSVQAINSRLVDQGSLKPLPAEGLSTPLSGFDTTDRSVQAIGPRSIARSIPEPTSSKTSSEFRSTDREKSIFFASDSEKNLRSDDQTINQLPVEGSNPSLVNDSGLSITIDRPSDRLPVATDLQVGDRVKTRSGRHMEGTILECHDKYAVVRWDCRPAVETGGADWDYDRLEKIQPQTLSEADIQEFSDLIRQAISDPSLASTVQEALFNFFSQNSQGKHKVWQALSKDEKEAFKALTIKPLDARGQLLEIGDQVEDLASEWTFGEVVSLEPSYRGSPKQPFVQWIAEIKWSSRIQTYHSVETLGKPQPISVKALTLHQPWASLVGKTKHYETRSWGTHYRGKIAIHAAKNSPECPIDLLELVGDLEDLPKGVVIAIADLTDCCEMTPEIISQQTETELKCGCWQPGRFAWKLENVRFLKDPIPATGAQGLWNWSPTKVESRHWTPQVGDRAQLKKNGSPLTIKEVAYWGISVVYDDGLEARLSNFDVKPLPPDKDPKIIAQKLFTSLQAGDELRALKHPDHKGFARRRGKFLSKRQEDGKFLASCETNAGIEIFNLEAVEQISE